MEIKHSWLSVESEWKSLALLGFTSFDFQLKLPSLIIGLVDTSISKHLLRVMF